MSWRFLVALFALGCALNVQAEPQVHSLYVPGADATRLAVDVWREASADGGQVEKVPAIVQFTRYWRSFRGASVNGGQAASLGRFFTNAGYAVVVVDVRGTGASFGARDTEFSEAEIADFAAVVRSVADEHDAGVLLIDHNMALVMEVCDRIHVLDQGRTLAQGTPAEIRENLDVTAAYLGEPAVHDA